MEMKQGDLENILLNAVWQMEEAGSNKINVVNIKNIINTDENSWAYTTIKTVLDRLVKKGTLRREKFQKKYIYRSNISRVDAGIIALNKLVCQYFKGEFKELAKTVDKINTEFLALTR